MNIGLDLGTSTVQVFVPKRGVILNEPTVVAMDRNSNKILAVGSQAREMLGRTPANIAAVRPLRDGVVADLEATEALVAKILSKVKGWLPVRPHVTLAVPSRITTVERRLKTAVGTVYVGDLLGIADAVLPPSRRGSSRVSNSRHRLKAAA